MGYTPAQAGNFVATLVGLEITPNKPWTLKQVNSLLFIKSISSKLEE